MLAVVGLLPQHVQKFVSGVNEKLKLRPERGVSIALVNDHKVCPPLPPPSVQDMYSINSLPSMPVHDMYCDNNTSEPPPSLT
jgi:hypothetical protein